MTDISRVTYSVEAVELKGRPPDYPTLGIRFQTDDAGDMLRGIDHTFRTGNGLDRNEVIRASRSAFWLKLLFAAISYRNGFELNVLSIHCEHVSSCSNTSSGGGTGLITTAADSLIAARVDMPSESTLTSADPRLPIWLHLANEARDAAGSGLRDHDAYALRNYDMIVEELDCQRTLLPNAREIGWARTLVSHGGRLKNHGKRDQFFERELGEATPCYDPSDPVHQAFVKKWREKGHNLVVAELDKLLVS